MAAATSVFKLSSTSKDAIILINGLDAKKLSLICSRVLQYLINSKSNNSANSNNSNNNNTLFTDEEIAQLQTVLSLTPIQLELIINFLLYLYEQAGYFNLTVDKFTNELTNSIQITTEQQAAITNTYSNHREEYNQLLRTQSIAETQLNSVNWKLNINLANNKINKEKGINAIVQLGISGNASDPHKKITFECNQEDLQRLYESCELVQKQLDALAEK